MRRRLVCLAVLLAVSMPGLPVGAEEAPPKRYTSLTEIVNDIVKAHETGDVERLKAVAGLAYVDPWLVVDRVCVRGKHDAAAAYVHHLPKKAAEKLPAYIERLRGRPSDTADLEMLDSAIAAHERGEWKAVIKATEALSDELDTVPRLWMARLRARAMAQLKQLLGFRLALRSARAARDLGWLHGSLRAYGAVHDAIRQLGYFEKMAGVGAEYLAVAEVLPSRSHMIDALTWIGLGHKEAGDRGMALDHATRAHALLGDVEDSAFKLRLLWRIAKLYGDLGNNRQGIQRYEDALKIAKRLGSSPAQRQCLIGISGLYFERGDYRRAMTWLKRALRSSLAEGASDALADIHERMARIHQKQGSYGDALIALEEAWKLEEAHGTRRTAEALRNFRSWRKVRFSQLNRAIGSVYADLGDLDRALAYLHAAAETDAGSPSHMMDLHSLIGRLHLRMGDPEQAGQHHRISLFFRKTQGNRGALEVAYADIGDVFLHAGKYDEALAEYAEAMKLLEERDDRPEQARVLRSIGLAYARKGHTEKGLDALERAASLARRLKSVPAQVLSQKTIAKVKLDAGDLEEALAEAEGALDKLETLYTGLGEGEGHRARGQHADLFATGALAAAGTEDLRGALRFLDSARAGLLLESLGDRESLEDANVDLPPALLAAEKEAQASVLRARRAYGEVARSGNIRKLRAAADALDAALDAEEHAVDRIQREIKRKAGRSYEPPATLDEVSAELKPGQALVVYGMCHAEALAVVVTTETARLVELGPAEAVHACCEELLRSMTATTPETAREPSAAGRETAPRETDRGASTARARKLLVAPLGLTADVKELILSPQGPIGYVPFAALVDLPVTMTPSATTHVLLQREERRRGEGVLAIGDPDYGGTTRADDYGSFSQGQKLPRLPATRKEAQDVGDDVLLGRDANEILVRKQLAKRERWRAVHFACHGLVEPERPLMSSLALSMAPGSDGFLTVLEVLRTEIPADLAVLSACETGRGKIQQGEGIVGLARAFMYAGTSRVMCSLWKVDDEATGVLMRAFYEHWSPPEGEGLSAAAALRKAQEYVRSHPKWQDPYYWGAWVLWGLPR